MEDVNNSTSKSPSTLLDKPGSSNVALDDPVELDTLIESSLQKVISFCRDKSLKEVSHVLKKIYSTCSHSVDNAKLSPLDLLVNRIF